MSETREREIATEEQTGQAILSQSAQESTNPKLHWDQGTAYDLFISLMVLHYPDKFGLRPSWAAGVRSRLQPEERETLEMAQDCCYVPFHWISTLPDPKDATSALWALRQIPVEKRLPTLALGPNTTEEQAVFYRRISERGEWSPDDRKFYVHECCEKAEGSEPKAETVENVLNAWANPVKFGEQYLNAMLSYQQAFFAEEEKHIADSLVNALRQAQELAQRLSLMDLLESLSQGVQFQESFHQPELMLIPSYWITPLVLFGEKSAHCTALAFGARPATASLVPGELIPESLLRALKALADPTRLRILNFLASEALTQAELARRLRLRAPTVTHHLNVLRLAGLVQFSLLNKQDRRYAARLETIYGLGDSLKEFFEANIQE